MTVIAADAPDAIERAVAALAAGEVIGVPTDTVYGLAADPFRPGAADRIFSAKGRPRNVELPVLVSGVEQALTLVSALPPLALRLTEEFWPGALTIVLPRRPGLGADLGDDGGTIGVRCPAHPVPLALAGRHGPIATTSANRHGEPPVTTATGVAGLPGVDLVIDGGTCAGAPSTVLDCSGPEPRVLRAGRIPVEALRLRS